VRGGVRGDRDGRRGERDGRRGERDGRRGERDGRRGWISHLTSSRSTCSQIVWFGHLSKRIVSPRLLKEAGFCLHCSTTWHDILRPRLSVKGIGAAYILSPAYLMVGEV
jgi:hypothetical protein